MPERIVFTVRLGELAEVPGSPFAYWAPESLRGLFKKNTRPWTGTWPACPTSPKSPT